MPTKYFYTERPENDSENEFWFHSVPFEDIFLEKKWPSNVDLTLCLLIEFDFRPEIFKKILGIVKGIKLMLCKKEDDGCDLQIFGKKGLIISQQFQPKRKGWQFSDLDRFGFVGDNEFKVWERKNLKFIC